VTSFDSLLGVDWSDRIERNLYTADHFNRLSIFLDPVLEGKVFKGKIMTHF